MFLENAHSMIDNLIQGNSIKSRLKEFTNIKDIYPIGERGYFQNNLINSLVGAGTGPERFEDLLELSIGGQFGDSQNPWEAQLTGSKGNIGFDISKLF